MSLYGHFRQKPSCTFETFALAKATAAQAALEVASAEAASLQAAALQAASYDMYTNAAASGQPPKAANMANSPSSFYPWMKNYNGKNCDLVH